MATSKFAMNILIGLLLTIAISAGLSLGCSDSSWELFKKEYHRNYGSVQEEIKRRSIFCKNFKKIYDHNEQYKNGEVTFEMNVNRFTDWTSEEFHKWLIGEIDMPINYYKF